MTNFITKYVVLSPDGIDIDGKEYDSQEEANKAFEKWASRYKEQGHYSSRGEKIPLDHLKERCSFPTRVYTDLFSKGW